MEEIGSCGGSFVSEEILDLRKENQSQPKSEQIGNDEGFEIAMFLSAIHPRFQEPSPITLQIHNRCNHPPHP